MRLSAPQQSSSFPRMLKIMSETALSTVLKEMEAYKLRDSNKSEKELLVRWKQDGIERDGTRAAVVAAHRRPHAAAILLNALPLHRFA